jgi:tRNA nucleotidyltransferase (CCA-adding enzyme)
LKEDKMDSERLAESLEKTIENTGFKVLRKRVEPDGKILIEFVDKKMKGRLEPPLYYESGVYYDPSTKRLDTTIRKLVCGNFIQAELRLPTEERVRPHVNVDRSTGEVIFSMEMSLNEESINRFKEVLYSMQASSSGCGEEEDNFKNFMFLLIPFFLFTALERKAQS